MRTVYSRSDGNQGDLSVKHVIVIRYGELYLKGKNRNYFERILVKNIKYKLKPFSCTLEVGRSRYLVTNYDETQQSAIIGVLKTVFGIASLSVAVCVSNEYTSIVESVLSIAPRTGTFRVNVHRGDKRYPMTSIALAAKLGEEILRANTALQVDLHTPQHTVCVDVREDGTAYVYSEVIEGAGGMPVGCAGKGLLLLSGGIDSPVAGYMMAKRGLRQDVIHFHSYPYTSERAKEKVIRLADILRRYCGKIHMYCVPVTKIQEEIHKHCSDAYMITILRRSMMRIAERVAQKYECGCLVNGESLGQVASQTLESITVTNDVITSLPVFRPLIGMDKQEIINISEKIGTYETSILPYEDCCTVFLPENPVTRPTLLHVREEENKIPDYEGLLREATEQLEIIRIYNGEIAD